MLLLQCRKLIYAGNAQTIMQRCSIDAVTLNFI